MKELQAAKGRRKTVAQQKTIEKEKTRRSSVMFKRAPKDFLCNIQQTIQNLLDQEDTTKNKTITIEDSGPKKYLIETHSGSPVWIEGNYSISTLLQELALTDINLKTVSIPEDRINEDPMTRLTRLIKSCFWKNLKRVLDVNGLKIALIDTKIKRVECFLYVPAYDKPACAYYKELEQELKKDTFNVKLIKLTRNKEETGGVHFEDSPSARSILSDSSPGLLTLSIKRFVEVPSSLASVNSPERLGSWHNPIHKRLGLIAEEKGPCSFYVPGGRFNEMYGWDSYFIAKGLIHSGELAEAMCIAENLRYQITSYGKILNANRTYYLFRGNPPLFSTLLDEIVEVLNPDERATHHNWIESCVDAAIKEHEYFHRGYNEDLGLSKHTPGGTGIPTETEDTHFYDTIRRIVKGASSWTDQQLSEYIEKYNAGDISDIQLEEYLRSDRAVRESGHDTTKRLEGVAADTYTVDLNSLLYKMETDILRYREHPEIERISKKRKTAINTLLWRGNWYYDYNGRTKTHSPYKGASSLYPLFAMVPTKEIAEQLVSNMNDLIGKGGVLSGTKESSILLPNEMQRQWDYPYGWAPHQILTWIGLMNYGYHKKARHLALLWCTMVGRIFSQYNGIVTEKYNVEQGSHKAAVEYGNVGMDIEYVPKEGFGWTNASWLIGLVLLKEEGRRELYARITLL
ncbi:alpha,alpha-trehalase [Nematocida sp. LUAm3]|nr:alpha,alpha-trehalase [Nematocida sp. LUAm3]KAI5175188.1 alpha,alpha-trehalase [Nematocida sp. LUAm2]KAI5178140.1 alpha,alpha-trehalase [Nematocida sp. LUAm1]